jgi:hypothetical protein
MCVCVCVLNVETRCKKQTLPRWFHKKLHAVGRSGAALDETRGSRRPRNGEQPSKNDSQRVNQRVPAGEIINRYREPRTVEKSHRDVDRGTAELLE